MLTPLSRRLMLITNVPFVVHNNVSDGLPTIDPENDQASPNQTTFGDVSFTPRVLLYESRDFSVTADLTVLTPTGDDPVAGRSALIPSVAFWYNFAGGWVIRGGLASNVVSDTARRGPAPNCIPET